MPRTPKRTTTLRVTTTDAADALAERYTRSASDVHEAAIRLATRAANEDKSEAFARELDAVTPLQPTRGTGRRARRDAKNEASQK